MKELLHRAAPSDVTSVDTAALRRRAQTRQRRHRIAAGGVGVVAVLAIAAAAVGLPRNRADNVADETDPITLFCRLQVGDESSDIVTLDPAIGVATALVGDYRAEFAIEPLPTGKTALRGILYGPAPPGSAPNRDLPPGAILGAASEFDPAAPPPGARPWLTFFTGSSSMTRIIGECSTEATAALPNETMSTDPPSVGG